MQKHQHTTGSVLLTGGSGSGRGIVAAVATTAGAGSGAAEGVTMRSHGQVEGDGTRAE